MSWMKVVRVITVAVTAVLISGCFGNPSAFEDDFSDTSSGWDGISHEMYARGYVGGKYVFQIFVPNWFVWGTAGKSYTDVEVEALVRSEGKQDNHFGLICRYDDDQFYYFAISADGYYAIYRREANTNLIPLTGSAMLQTSLIRTDNSENRLVALCQGSQLIFFINGEKVAEVTDESLTKGDVGMAAGTISSDGSNLWFDDFKVRKP